MRLKRTQLSANPVEQFHSWYKEFQRSARFDHSIVTLATADQSGRPSARVVLLKAYGEEGFVFYTNTESRKGQDLSSNPQASLLFYWPELDRQIRLDGPVEVLDRGMVREYFHSRPRGSQLGAVVSQQSQPIDNMRNLLDRQHDLRIQLEGKEVPLPACWGGYRLQPEQIEFWQAGADRLHDRICYTKSNCEWTKIRLQP